MKNSSFDIRNCWNTFRWIVLTNRRLLTNTFIGIAVLAFIVGGYITTNLFSPFTPIVEPRDIGAYIELPIIFIQFLFLWMLYGASQTFVFMKSKQSAITYLMHPASNAEKFVARLAYTTLLWTALGLMGLLVGDLVRWAFGLVLGSKAPMAIVALWRNVRLVTGDFSLSGEGLEALKYATAFMLYCFWIYTFYILGSAVFRRHRILFTTIAVTVLHMMVAGNLMSLSYDGISWGMVSLLLAVLSVADIVAAYCLFCRMQVINNKWFNI